jgi:hypothetical protein
MNRYQPSTFRPAFGLAALALTVFTLLVTVIVPAGLSSADRDTTTPVASAAMATEVAIRPARIDVTASPARAVVIESVDVVPRSQRPAG